jgi:hypothetical protein
MKKSLTDLVEIYIRNCLPEEEWELNTFRSEKKDLEDLIESAVWGYLPNLKQNGHQHRIPRTVLNEMNNKLHDSAIVNELGKCKKFDDIFTIVYCLKVPNFNSLCVYDTAHRLGAKLNLYPTVIYLHSGALEGAIKLLGTDMLSKVVKYYMKDNEFPYIKIEDLPQELSKLTPYQIVNFLCRKKDMF